MAMQLRVTDSSITTRVLNNLQGNLTRVGNLQEQLSSGKLISRPSDSPTGTVSAMQLRGESRAVQQYSRNADDGLGWLAQIDTALNNTLSQTGKARELVLRGMSFGSGSSASGREALAVEVANIRESLIQVANTKYLDRPVFGGTTTEPQAFTVAGKFAGDGGQVMRTIGDNTKVQVDANGKKVFGEDDSDSQLFTVLDHIVTNLRNGANTDLTTDLQNLDIAIDTIKTNLSDVGARTNRFEHMKNTAEDRILSVKSQLSEIEDIDLPNTIMQMQLQQTAYQAALQATAKVIQPSLMDFLR